LNDDEEESKLPPPEEKITKKVKSTENRYSKKPYSQRYYEILEGRKKLPAWEARE
jgi:pre-mRNA-splicing factor ATP-dependent RNA helicase DHX15/PRP43